MIRGTKQKFYMYDLVELDAEMPDFMSHFRAGGKAIVLGSYYDLCDSYNQERDGKEFKLLFPDGYTSCWYCEEQLKLIEVGRVDLAEEWVDKA